MPQGILDQVMDQINANWAHTLEFPHYPALGLECSLMV